MSGKKFGVLLAATALLGVGAIVPASAQATPAPLVPAATKGDAFVSPSVLRALQDGEKGAASTVRVVVSFDLRAGRSGAFSTSSIRTAQASVLSALPAGSYEVVSTFDRIPSVALEVDQASLAALAANPLVSSINEDNVVRTSMAEANAVTGVASVHTGGITGAGVTVGIIDTGVDSNGGVVHPSLADDIVGQACFRTENDCVGGPTSAEDVEGHGTHVAGIITGPEGVAPDANVYALKVFTTGTTSDTNILNALDHVIGLNTTTPGTIDIINMSLGGANFADQATCDANGAAYVTAFATLIAQGVTIFVATGNDAETNAVGSPSCITGAVGVGSTGDAVVTNSFSACTDFAEPDKVSCYSNATPVQGVGELVDLMAPGCSITSTGLDGITNDVKCGTSMATPYAAGSAALLMQYLDDHALSMTPSAIETHMEATGVQISDYRLAPGAPTFPRVSPPAMIGSLALDAPLSFLITGTTSSSVSTSWSAVAAATEYRVYASVDGGPATMRGTVTAPATTFTDTTAACGSLTYFVKAFNGSFESLASNTDTDTARACPLTPGTLALSVVDGDSHTLTWTDGNLDETSNMLQRSVNGGAFVDYQSTAAGTNMTFTDDNVACGVYRYRAVAERNGDLSAPTNVVQRAVCAPANDDFANAEVVTAEIVYTDTEPNQSYGTEEATDPVYDCHFGGAAAGFQGVWYEITPAVNTRVTVSTGLTTIFGPSSSAPDTLAAIFTGSVGSLTTVACNDDISGSNFRSSVTSDLTAGTTYHVFVSQWYDLPVGTVGDLVTAFTWSAPLVIPDNDLVANARVVDSATYTSTVTAAQNATTSLTDLPHECASNSSGTGIAPRIGSHTLWWTYTPPSDGMIDLDTLSSSGSFTDTILTVYSGTSGAFAVAACNDDEESAGVSLRSEILDLAVTGGTTYTIYVSRWSNTPTTTTGAVVLDVTFTADPAVIVSPTTIDVTEVGPTDTYTLALTTAPTSNVTVSVTGDADCFTDVPDAVFTPANWATAQTVTVTAVNDLVAEGPHSCTIAHSATSGDATYNGLSVGSVTGAVTDRAATEVTIAPGSVDVTEGGATDTYTLVLESAPTADVTIGITGDADCEADLTEAVFTTANWNVAQTVTVTAVDDLLAEGSHSCTISHSASSSDGGYNGLIVSSVSGTVTDHVYPASVSISKVATTASLPEPGGSFEFTITIDNTSATSVEITSLTDTDTLSSACQALVSVTLAAGGSATCTTTVTHTAVGSYDSTVTVDAENAFGSTDSASDTETVEVTDVALVDGDVIVTVTPSPSTIPETGANVTYTVEVENNSDQAVTIDDLQGPALKPGDIEALTGCNTAVSTVVQPGETFSCTFTEFVAGEADNGPVNRTVTVIVSDGEGNELITSESASVALTNVVVVTTSTTVVAPTTTIRRGIPATGGSFSNTLVVAGSLLLLGGALVVVRRRGRPATGLR